MEMRYILRSAYDGDFERTIRELVKVIEKQQEEINNLREKLESFN